MAASKEPSFQRESSLPPPDLVLLKKLLELTANVAGDLDIQSAANLEASRDFLGMDGGGLHSILARLAACYFQSLDDESL